MATLAEIASSDLKTAALAYHMIGLSIIPLAGKKPAVDWKKYQQSRADSFQVKKWFLYSRNIGIICGRVSQNLCVIDLDGLEAISTFERQWPDLLDTFAIATGSGRGKHLYYIVQELPKTTRLMAHAAGNIELRADGTYVVAAPSVHPDTLLKYKVAHAGSVRRLPNMNEQVEWLEALQQALPAPNPEAEAESQRTGRTNGEGKGQIRYPGRYAQAALYKEASEFRSVPEGSRNTRLNVAAYNMGQIVAEGWISREAVETTLLASARVCGLPEGEALATIRSGLLAGMNESRSQQWKKR